MIIDDIKENMNKLPYVNKVLLIKKQFYEKHKKEINNLMKENMNMDVFITSYLDAQTDVVIVDKEWFYEKTFGCY